MTTESTDQVREKHLRDMGTDLGTVYHLLWGEVAWLHAKWNQYRQLYGHSPDRIALLNKVASHFFGVVQHALLDDVLMHLARLTDPPKSNRLTLLRLPRLVHETVLQRDLKRLVQGAVKACEAAVSSSRNQRIAHTDFARAKASSFDLLPSRADVEAALAAIRKVLHRLEVHYWQSETAYQLITPTPGEAESVVYFLQKGRLAEERRSERLISGKPLPEDLEPDGTVDGA